MSACDFNMAKHAHHLGWPLEPLLVQVGGVHFVELLYSYIIVFYGIKDIHDYHVEENILGKKIHHRVSFAYQCMEF